MDGDLDAKSYKKLFEEIQTQIDERSKGAEGATQQILTVVNAQYELEMENATTQAQKAKIQEEYDKDVAEISSNLAKTKIEVSEVGMSFAYDKIKEHWKPEMDIFGGKTQNAVQETLQTQISEGLIGIDPNSDMQALMMRTVEAFNTAYYDSGMTKAARTNLEDFLKILEPTSEDNKTLADEYIATGQTIPDTLIDQLTDEASLKALAGDIDAIYFLMGQQLADSPEILTMLENGELTAEELDASVIRGMETKRSAVEAQGKSIIDTLDKAIKAAAKYSQNNKMPGYAAKMIKGINKGFNDDTSGKSTVQKWLGVLDTTIKNWKLPELIAAVKVDSSALTDFYTAQGGNIGLPTKQYKDGGFVKKFATGGIADFGQMFIAREAGPELVGTIGNQTAVVNNDQILQGITNAVIQGNQMSQSSNNQQVVIENVWRTDSETLYRETQIGRQSADRRYHVIAQPV